MAGRREIEWSPKGWLLTDPATGNKHVAGGSITFSEISFEIMQTVTEASRVRDEIEDAVLKNKLESQSKVLKSAAAQFVAAGQAYNADQSPDKERAMKDMEAVVGAQHKKVLEMIKEAQEKKGGSGGNQKQVLVREMDKALGLVQEWQGQLDLMQIDADTFYTAADRLVRAWTSIIKIVLVSQGKDVQIDIARQVQAWGKQCQQFRDIFLPREEKKWLTVDAHYEEAQVFSELNKINKRIRSFL